MITKNPTGSEHDQGKSVDEHGDEHGVAGGERQARPAPSGTFVILGTTDGRPLCAHRLPDGEVTLRADEGDPVWFEWIRLGEDRFALRQHLSTHHLSVHGDREIRVAPVEVGRNETFQAIGAGALTFMLRLADSQFYLSVPPGRGAAVTVQTRDAGPEELLKLRPLALGQSGDTEPPFYGCAGPAVVRLGAAGAIPAAAAAAPTWNDRTHSRVVELAVDRLRSMQNPTAEARFIVRLWDNDPDFKKKVLFGLHDADCNKEWTSPEAGFPTWRNHFYDPDNGLNYYGEPGGAAQVGADTFWQSLRSGPVSVAAYYLGVSLHHLTDLTQPMHAANFASVWGEYESTWVPYFDDLRHGGFEEYAEDYVTNRGLFDHFPPPALTPDDLKDFEDPRSYLHETAVLAKKSWTSWLKGASAAKLKFHWWGREYINTWGREADPSVQDDLPQAPGRVARYLTSWARWRSYNPAKVIVVLAVGESDGRLYARTTLNGTWNQVPNSGTVSAVTVRRDGSIWGIRKSDNRLLKGGMNFNGWSGPIEDGGWLGITAMPNGSLLAVGGDYMLWTNPDGARWQVPNSGSVVAVAAMPDSTIWGIRKDGNRLIKRETLYSNWSDPIGSGSFRSITAMPDGSLLGIRNGDNRLCTIDKAGNSTLVPASGDVVAVSLVTSGVFLGVGNANSLWVRPILSLPWTPVPSSGSITAVAVKRDGTIWGIQTSTNTLWKRTTLNETWSGPIGTGKFMGITGMPDGTLLGVGMDYMLWTNADANFGQVPKSDAVIAVAAMPDGSFWGIQKDSHRLWKRAALQGVWTGPIGTREFLGIAAMPDGGLLGVEKKDKFLYTIDELGNSTKIENSGEVSAISHA